MEKLCLRPFYDNKFSTVVIFLILGRAVHYSKSAADGNWRSKTSIKWQILPVLELPPAHCFISLSTDILVEIDVDSSSVWPLCWGLLEQTVPWAGPALASLAVVLVSLWALADAKSQKITENLVPVFSFPFPWLGFECWQLEKTQIKAQKRIIWAGE